MAKEHQHAHTSNALKEDKSRNRAETISTIHEFRDDCKFRTTFPNRAIESEYVLHRNFLVSILL
jgi:hypothetical protein